MALGAHPAWVMAMVLRDVPIVTIAGLTLGTISGVLLGTSATTLLFGLESVTSQLGRGCRAGQRRRACWLPLRPAPGRSRRSDAALREEERPAS